MRKLTMLVLAGLASVAVCLSLLLSGSDVQERVYDPFPKRLAERIFPFGTPGDIAVRNIQMDKQGRYPEFIFDTFKNGDKGVLRLHSRGTLAEVTVDQTSKGIRVWYRLALDGVTILEKRTVDLKTDALIDEGERMEDRRFILREYFAGTTDFKRVRIFEPRAYILRNGMAGVDMTREDVGYWPNKKIQYEFTAQDSITSQRHSYTIEGVPESYLKVEYRYRKGWFFYPDGVTKRMVFERLKIERNSTGFWEVHTDYYNPDGTLDTRRIFTRDAMITTVDVPGFGTVKQTWAMINSSKDQDSRLLPDNFIIRAIELDQFQKVTNVRFDFQGGVLKELWFQTKLSTGEQVKVFQTLDVKTGRVLSERVVDASTGKEIKGGGMVLVLNKPSEPIRIPDERLLAMLKYQPPPVVALEPDYDWGH